MARGFRKRLAGLTDNDLKKVGVTTVIADISTAGQAYATSPVAGKIVSIVSVLNGAISGADSVLTAKINGAAVTGGTLTVAQSGSAAGDKDTATPTAANTVAEGDTLEIETDGASTGAQNCFVTFIIDASQA